MKVEQNFSQQDIDWNKGDGLIPAVVQDAETGVVLMLGYVNQEALSASLSSGFVTFYSRSKKRLWKKGETSGHVLELKSVKLDCDGDTFLMMAHPKGPTCHKGSQSCFGDEDPTGFAVLAKLASVIKERKAQGNEESYTSKLFKSGIQRIAQKVGEEGVEVALAAQAGGSPLIGEVADLTYHVSVLLEASNASWQDVMDVLSLRSKGKQ